MAYTKCNRHFYTQSASDRGIGIASFPCVFPRCRCKSRNIWLRQSANDPLDVLLVTSAVALGSGLGRRDHGCPCSALRAHSGARVPSAGASGLAPSGHDVIAPNMALVGPKSAAAPVLSVVSAAPPRVPLLVTSRSPEACTQDTRSRPRSHLCSPSTAATTVLSIMDSKSASAPKLSLASRDAEEEYSTASLRRGSLSARMTKVRVNQSLQRTYRCFARIINVASCLRRT